MVCGRPSGANLTQCVHGETSCRRHRQLTLIRSGTPQDLLRSTTMSSWDPTPVILQEVSATATPIAEEEEYYSSWSLFLVCLLLILSLWTSYYLQIKRIKLIHETLVAIFAGMFVGLVVRLAPGTMIREMLVSGEPGMCVALAVHTPASDMYHRRDIPDFLWYRRSSIHSSLTFCCHQSSSTLAMSLSRSVGSVLITARIPIPYLSPHRRTFSATLAQSSPSRSWVL